MSVASTGLAEVHGHGRHSLTGHTLDQCLFPLGDTTSVSNQLPDLAGLLTRTEPH